MMKYLGNILLLFSMVSIFGNIAVAHERHHPKHGHNHYTSARVIKVIPLYREIQVPHRHRRCLKEVVTYEGRPNPTGGMIAGGIIGGVIGNELGRGHRNRPVATAVGGLIGAAIGRDAARHAPPSYSVVERHCTPVTNYSIEQRVVGYRVMYRLHGRTYVTRTDYHPGPRIRVKIYVEPERY